MSKTLFAVTTALLLAVSASTAKADTILVFGQTATGTDFTATNNGDGTTSLTATDLLVDITGFAGGSADGVYFNFDAISINDATVSGGGTIEQNFMGTFTITSGAGGSGINYLSGSFTDIFLGVNTGTAAALLASTGAGDALAFTSDLGTPIPALGIALSFINLTPGLSVSGQNTANATIASFEASVSGEFQADDFDRDIPVPEPGSLMLLGGGLMGLATSVRKRLRRKNQ